MAEKIYTNILFHLGFVEIISLPQKGVITGVFLANQTGKYCQQNQNNTREHLVEYNNTKRNPSKRRYTNKYTQENPKINPQDKQKITFPGSAYPKEISQQYTPATHTEAVHCQGILLGVFHPCLWPLKAPGSTFVGRVTKPLVSSLTPVLPW